MTKKSVMNNIGKNPDKMASFLFYITIVIIFFTFIVNYRRDVELVEAKDGEKYLVRKMPDKKQAADMLSDIKNTLSGVVNIIKGKTIDELYTIYLDANKASSEKDKLNKEDFENSINRLIKNYNPKACIFSENVPTSTYTAYTVNKGEEIVFCLRLKREGDALVPLNTILFVALHEITHIMTKSIGHEPEFWNNFSFILKIAIDDCLYDSVDYSVDTKKYCGIDVTSTPYHQDSPPKCNEK
jgi:hypothetical protein